MKNFLKQNSIILALFLISLGSTVFFYSRSQIPTSIQEEILTSEQGIDNPIEKAASIDNELAFVTPSQKPNTQISSGMTNASSSETNTESSTSSSEQAEMLPTEGDTSEKETIKAILHIPDIDFEATTDLPPGSNAYDLMKTLRDKRLTYEANEHGSLGAFISSIGGVANDYKEHMFWIYYVNGQKANIGISNYILTQDDIITWQYEAEDI